MRARPPITAWLSGSLVGITLIACSSGGTSPATGTPGGVIGAPQSATGPALGNTAVAAAAATQQAAVGGPAAAFAATATARAVDAQAINTANAIAQEARRATQVVQLSDQATASAANRATQAVIAGATGTAAQANALASVTAMAATQQAARAVANSTATGVAASQTSTAARQEAGRLATLTAVAPTAVPTPTIRLPTDPAAPQLLTSYFTRLLILRDNPQLISDDALLNAANSLIAREQFQWQEVDCFGRPLNDPTCSQPGLTVGPGPFKLNPTRSTFTFEWQKYITEHPDIARGPLLDVFVREDADWSFVKREPGWDDSFDNFVQMFVFSRSSIDGRRPEFVAPDLVPVYHQLLDAVAAKAPTRFVVDLDLPTKYDLASKSYRFAGSSDFDLLTPFDWGGWGASRPQAVAQMFNYSMPPLADRLDPDGASGRLSNVVGLRLAAPIDPGSRIWRQSVPGSNVPRLTVLSLDHSVQLKPLPVDPAKAEALTNKHVNLSVRLIINVDHAYTITTQGQPFDRSGGLTGIAARVEKMLVIAAPQNFYGTKPNPQDEEVLATLI